MFRLSSIFSVLTFGVLASPTYFNATDPRIIYSNSRFLKNTGDVSFVWSGATISATFTGTSIGVVMRDPHGQYDIFIDEQKTFVPFVPQATTPLPFVLAEQLTDGIHTFMMRKRTEPFSNIYGDGTASITNFFVDQEKTLLQTQPSSVERRKIEVIGDSITCGAGILGDNSTCPFSFATQDYFSSYTYLLAQKFKAEVNTMCWSGKGLVRNFNDSCTDDNATMPTYYPYTLDNNDNVWNFSSFIPDAVIVNLGTNDFAPNPCPPMLNETFITAYVNFTREIQAKYQDNAVHIFLVCRSGKSLPGPCDLVREAVKATQNSLVHYLDITPTNETLGCGGHPGRSSHLEMAAKLIAGVGSTVGWSEEMPPAHLEASSAVLLGAFFLIGLGGHIWGCVVRKPKRAGLLLEQTHD